MKVQYIGDHQPINVKLPLGTQRNWMKNEIRDLPAKCANKLVNENINFKYIDNVKKEVIKEPQEEEFNLDLNGDGVVDAKDYSIAGKVLASKRKK